MIRDKVLNISRISDSENVDFNKINTNELDIKMVNFKSKYFTKTHKEIKVDNDVSH